MHSVKKHKTDSFYVRLLVSIIHSLLNKKNRCKTKYVLCCGQCFICFDYQNKCNAILINRGYSGFYINTWFIFIEWYENKYFMNGGGHEWNMIIFIPQLYL
jgi:hypothetical protein